jgi:hypothetical protein
MMFTQPPPRAPEVPPVPCPACQTWYAVQLYATSRVEYYRCETCRQVFTTPHHDEPGHDHLEAA